MVTLLAVLNLLGGVAAVGIAGAMIFMALADESTGGGQAPVTVLFAVYGLVGLVQVATGVGLLRLEPWARHLQIGLAVVGLLGIPCGTLISVLILVYMLKPEVKTLFSGISPQQLPPDQLARVERLSGSSGAIVVVVAVVAILGGIFLVGMVAAIAIPSLLRARVAANEAAALRDLRAVVSAQRSYSVANNGYPDQLECLARPQQCLPPGGEPFMGHFDTSLLTPRRRGYAFQFVPGPPAPPEVVSRGHVSRSSLSGWAYTAVPLSRGQTGLRSFCADMSGVVCFVGEGAELTVRGGACPVASERAEGSCIPLR